MPQPRTRWQFALRARAAALRDRHARAFWILHSLWALAQGVAVAVLAEERPDYGAWLFGLLALVWLSTLFFCRSALVVARPGSLRVGFVSYATRVLYQQTLFFLLPFYVRSTTPSSPNLAFTVALALLALLACLDLSFDRWLRRSPAFGATFFFAVAYATLQVVLPLAARVQFEHAQPLALGLALVAALVSVGLPRGPERAARLRGVLPAAGLALALLAAPLLVPPAPLRVAGFEVETHAHSVRAVVRVAAPVPVPVDVTLQWQRGRALLRASRGVSITAHGGGFRVWDDLSLARLELGADERGPVRIEVRTATGQLVGRRALPSGIGARAGAPRG
jgi:predicted secreted protein